MPPFAGRRAVRGGRPRGAARCGRLGFSPDGFKPVRSEGRSGCGTMLFGEFLFVRCIVDEQSLLAALGEQIRSRPLLGEIAVREGYMSARDVFRVINEQAQRRRYFGDVALELGLVSPEELEHMLAVQAAETTPLGEILVGRGELAAEELDTLLAEHERLKAREGARNGSGAAESAVAGLDGAVDGVLPPDPQ